MSLLLKPSNSVFGPSTVNGAETITGALHVGTGDGSGITVGTSLDPLVTNTAFGYSPGYRVEMLGRTSGNLSLAFGYDPSTNANSGFTGDGSELIFRNGAKFITPNAVNNGWLTALTFNNGDVKVGGVSPITLRDNAALTGASGIRTGGGGSLVVEASGPLYLQNDNSGNVIANLGGGNFGVGVTSPTQAKLQVAGNIQSDTGWVNINYDSLEALKFTSGTYGNDRFWLGTDAFGFAINDRTGAGLEVFRIANGGNATFVGTTKAAILQATSELDVQNIYAYTSLSNPVNLYTTQVVAVNLGGVGVNVGTGTNNQTLKVWGNQTVDGNSGTILFQNTSAGGTGYSLAKIEANRVGYDNIGNLILSTNNDGFGWVTGLTLRYDGLATFSHDVVVSGQAQFATTFKNTNATYEVTGAGSATLGANCPAVTVTAPYKWLEIVMSDGSVVYIPAWK